MNTNTIRELLAENLWKLKKSSHNEGKDTERVVRYIPEVKREGLRDQIKFMVEYASAMNQVPMVTITNPLIDGRPWTEDPLVIWNAGRIFLDYDEQKQLGLYQVLWRGGKTMDDVLTENGCQYRVTTAWYFDASSIIDLPEPSSGVNYTRSQILVDDDTGSFTYSIDKRVRLYQTVPEHVSRISPASTVYHAEHLGVRQGDVDHDGAPVPLPTMNLTPGSIIQIERSKQSDCTQNVGVQKVIPNDQPSLGAIRSAAADTNIEEHTEGPAITDFAAAAGTVRRVDQSPTDAGNMKSRNAVTIPKNQTSVSEEYSAVLMVSETLNTEGVTIADKSAPAGKVRRVEEVPTEAGNKRTTDRLETPVYLSDSGEYTTRDGIVKWWWGVNASVAEYAIVITAAAMDSTTDNHISKTKNRFGKIDYLITKQPYGGGVYLWGESLFGPFTRKDRQYAHMYSTTSKRVRRYKRDVTYTYLMAIKHNYEDAHSYQSGGEDGSTVQSHGNGRYVGIKVTGISDGMGWSEDERGVS